MNLSHELFRHANHLVTVEAQNLDTMIREHECTRDCDYDGGDFLYSSIKLDQVTVILAIIICHWLHLLLSYFVATGIVVNSRIHASSDRSNVFQDYHQADWTVPRRSTTANP